MIISDDVMFGNATITAHTQARTHTHAQPINQYQIILLLKAPTDNRTGDTVYIALNCV